MADDALLDYLERYNEELASLKTISRPVIGNLTVVAAECLKAFGINGAALLADAIEKHIYKARTREEVPWLRVGFSFLAVYASAWAAAAGHAAKGCHCSLGVTILLLPV